MLISKRYHPHPTYLPYPSSHISIRESIKLIPSFAKSFQGGAQEEKYAIVLVKNGKICGGTKILEEVEDSRAIFELYEGGVVSFMSLTKPALADFSSTVHASRHHLRSTLAHYQIDSY